MRIKVLQLVAGNPVALECETPAGRLIATWRGSEPPSVGESYDVEIDPVGELAWGDQVSVEAKPAGISGESLVGLVEDVDGGTVILRVSAAIVVLDVHGDPPLGVVGREVLVRPDAFELYPTGA
ncbi:hypothetical protein GCM10027053_47460 [Intrasporangium mesophilum]